MPFHPAKPTHVDRACPVSGNRAQCDRTDGSAGAMRIIVVGRYRTGGADAAKGAENLLVSNAT
jgi:hypothetical protein